MDGLHLPRIVKLREVSSEEQIKKGKITTTETCRNISRERLRSTEQVTSLRKRSNVDRQRRINSKKFAFSGGKVKSSPRIDATTKTQNVRRRINNNDSVGLPNIGSSSNNSNTGLVRNNIDIEATTSTRKTRQRRSRRENRSGDTISYVYSKSLKDENCMAFIRNCTDYGKTTTQRSSADAIDKKPYGLPSLSNVVSGESPSSSTEDCVRTVSGSDSLEGVDDI